MLEFLLINHPLDCPICDRGGECPLQDQTYKHGPGSSRYIEPKRTYEKALEISDLVVLDRERCVLCWRCVRFCDEIAGDAFIQLVDRGPGTQILTFNDEPFDSYFSGNTIQICPVGALTTQALPLRVATVGPQERAQRVLLLLGRLPHHQRIAVRASWFVARRFRTRTSTISGSATRAASATTTWTPKSA